MPSFRRLAHIFGRLVDPERRRRRSESSESGRLQRTPEVANHDVKPFYHGSHVRRRSPDLAEARGLRYLCLLLFKTTAQSADRTTTKFTKEDGEKRRHLMPVGYEFVSPYSVPTPSSFRVFRPFRGSNVFSLVLLPFPLNRSKQSQQRTIASVLSVDSCSKSAIRPWSSILRP